MHASIRIYLNPTWNRIHKFGEALMNCEFRCKLRPHILQGLRENPVATSCANVMCRWEKYTNRSTTVNYISKFLGDVEQISNDAGQLPKTRVLVVIARMRWTRNRDHRLVKSVWLWFIHPELAWSRIPGARNGSFTILIVRCVFHLSKVIVQWTWLSTKE